MDKACNEQICEDIMAFLRLIKKALAEVAEQYELTPIQLSVLWTIQRSHRATMGHVAQIMHCDASNATGLVDRLVVQGLVSRQENPDDRRVKVLQLTPRGERITVEAVSRLPNALGYERLSEEERRCLQGAIAKMSSSV